MGFNTTVVILNDALRYIEDDQEFGKRLAQKVRAISGARKPQWVRAGNAVNAALVVETHHADDIVTVAVGRNRGDIVRDDEGFPVWNHFCHACGRPHEGYEKKYCTVCGKAAQELKTLYEALHLIDIGLRDADDKKAVRARDRAREALMVAPEGERLGVLDWRAMHERRLQEIRDRLEQEMPEKYK